MLDNREIEVLEELNKEIITLRFSSEYELGRKVKRLVKEIRHGKFIEQIKRIQKKEKLKRIKEHIFLENVDDKTWYSQMHLGDPNKKVVVYTCITGGYDRVENPMVNPQNIDYILFQSNTINTDSSNWKLYDIPVALSHKYDNATINRYIKFHPHEFFSDDYDYSIYIDGNIRPVSDLSIYADLVDKSIGVSMHQHSSRSCIFEEVKACLALGKGNANGLAKQTEYYRSMGFPSEYGMAECNLIVCDLHNELSKEIMTSWWQEFMKTLGKRDQIALPYILWKKGISVSDVTTLGHNIYRNTKVQIKNHNSN